MSREQPQRLDEATIERARSAVPLASLVAKRVKLSRMGREWKGLCPFHTEKTPSFNVVESKGFYHCFGCGAHGSAIDWLMEVEGLGFREAVTSLLGGVLPDGRKAFHPPERTPTANLARSGGRFDFVSSATAGRWIFRTSGPARGEIVERWLEARGLDPAFEPLPGFPAIDQLRFHPRCPASVWRVDEDPHASRLTAPAMVAPIGDAEGAVWGVHVTYLSADGRSKARFPLVQGRERPTRKMFGKVGGNGVFLTPPDAMCSESPLVVGEGIETTWAFAQSRAPCRMVATLSLENLQGHAVKLRDGALPLWKVEADPDRAPFTLPDAGEVVVAVDADMKPLRDQKVQVSRGGKPVRRDLSGLDRAEICATLAAQAWRRAGASSVKCVRPRMGMDFNDQIRSAA
ncbi:MAG TPA: CHC2 zinc finger domain-containing protein [Sphingomicrobium sp.]|jgi:DNA primase